ncbi:WhiB family transcriptional regulator [Streptomyces decoyicus]|uniref:WhiB family transcriptional regulator n=1 Tax=Streptomyces decoyicus TaxID=249567 RepID=UPI003C12C620
MPAVTPGTTAAEPAIHEVVHQLAELNEPNRAAATIGVQSVLRLVSNDVPCRTTDPEVFHDRQHTELAKSLCSSCEYEAFCRAQARRNREWGCWGGETSKERAEAGYAPRNWSRYAKPQKPDTQEVEAA